MGVGWPSRRSALASPAFEKDCSQMRHTAISPPLPPSLPAFEKDCSQMRHTAMPASAGESPDTGEFEADSEVVAEGRVQELA